MFAQRIFERNVWSRSAFISPGVSSCVIASTTVDGTAFSLPTPASSSRHVTALSMISPSVSVFFCRHSAIIVR